MRCLVASILLLTAAPILAQMRPVRVSASVKSAAQAECKAEVLAAARVKAVLERASEAIRPMLEKRPAEDVTVKVDCPTDPEDGSDHWDQGQR